MVKMTRMLLMFWAALLPFLPISAAVTIQKGNRVANNKEKGICWFACAEMIGKELGIRPLHNITQQVLSTGIGRDHGARPQDIQHWMTALKLKLTAYHDDDITNITTWLDKGVPVIASIRHWETDRDPHAVLITGITPAKEDLIDGAGQKHNDRVVSFIDPNEPQWVLKHSLTWFKGQWLQRAYVFDPKDQPGLSIAQLTPTAPETLPGPPQPRVVLKAPHPIPSNQDLKDGVQRPADVIEHYAGVGYGHDYYAEYRQRR